MNSLPFSTIRRVALNEARLLFDNGVDGIIIENMADLPYQRPEQRGPETTAMMTDIASLIRTDFTESTIGVQVLSGGNREALAIAAAADLDFIRLESFVFGHVGDEGWTESNAAETLRYRKAINACDVKIMTDIKKKHSSHAITGDVDIGDTAVAADFFLTGLDTFKSLNSFKLFKDGVIITGTHTGRAADVEEFHRVKERVPNLPVWIGSGVTSDNIDAFQAADGLIIGSEFKVDGKWSNELDIERIRAVTMRK